MRLQSLLILGAVITLDNWFSIFNQLPVDPNREFLQVHSLVKIVVEHIGDDAGNALIIMLLH